jgi:hypothetical protein
LRQALFTQNNPFVTAEIYASAAKYQERRAMQKDSEDYCDCHFRFWKASDHTPKIMIDKPAE